jgi:hypothetical protein
MEWENPQQSTPKTEEPNRTAEDPTKELKNPLEYRRSHHGMEEPTPTTQDPTKELKNPLEYTRSDHGT